MSIDFTKMKVEDMRAELVRLTGINIEDAEAIKGKSQIAERILEARARLGLDDDNRPAAQFDNVELERTPLIRPTVSDDDEDADEEQPEEVAIPAPLMGSAAWQEYVLDHLNDDEYQSKDGKKFPKASGLRRVTQILCGPIIGSGPVREHMGQNGVTVVYEVLIQWLQGFKFPEYVSEQELAVIKQNLPVRRFTEIADCTVENTPHPYNLHAAATASTKAAGRVYKSILQLNCHTAEEMSLVSEAAKVSTDDARSVSMSVGDMDTEPVSGMQKITIARLAERLEIDIEKALGFHNLNSDLNKLTKTEAKDFIVLLNRYQTDVAEASMTIPDLIKSSPV